MNATLSRLCFGTLTLSPLQKNLSLSQGVSLLRSAADMGLNFYDTAELYNNYEYLKQAFSRDNRVHIATKSYAYSKEGARKSLEKYLKETGRERSELFLLHEQESLHTLRGHSDALEYYIQMKQEGLIGAVGISTHNVAAVKACNDCFHQVEVIHPMINCAGIGIVDGTVAEMEYELQRAYDRGVFIYAMKPLGGGHLIGKRMEALSYIDSLPFLSSVAVGIGDEDELCFNVQYFNREEIPKELFDKTAAKERTVLIQSWCESCGACAQACSTKALVITHGKLEYNGQNCVFCGYCGARCKNAAIKVI